MVRNGLCYFPYDCNSYRQNYFDICHPFFFFFFWELSNASSLPDASTGQTKSSSSFMHEDPIIYREIHEACAPATPQLAETVLDQDFVTGPSQVQSELTTSKLFHDSTTSSNLDMGDGRTGDSSQMWQDGPCIGRLLFCTVSLP